MEFGILGPLLIRDARGDTLTVRAAKQRTLIAALLLRAGQVVSVDHLVETLWDGRPPASAVPSLRNYVLRLRGGLGDAGQRIDFRDRGYVLDVAPDEVDLLRFARLRDEGAAAFDRGQFARAGDLLGRALEQWRGPALLDVESDALHREECPHLAESRLDVVELRLEAEFRAAGRVPWTAQLRDLARAHPERERLWEHLIRCLHQQGRRTEALAEYQRMERTLAEEYGVQPGERARMLREEILGAGDASGSAAAGDEPDAGSGPGSSAAVVVAGPANAADVPGSPDSAGARHNPTPPPTAPAPAIAPTLDAGPADGSTAGPTAGSTAGSRADSAATPYQPPAVPYQIPAAPSDFTGRTRHVASLVERLTRGPGNGPGSVTVISGQPGIGKTALALHVAHAVRSAYPDGALYADLHAGGGAPVPPDEVLASFLGALGVPGCRVPALVEDRAALLRTLLAQRRTLLVLDDARDAAHVAPLLPGPGSCAVLITSRTRIDDLCGAAHLEPCPLAGDDAVRLLGALAGRARVAAEPRPVADLVRACAGLPIALRIAGTRLAARPSRSVRWLADRLAVPTAALDELKVGRLDVRAGLAEVCRGLDSAQAHAFHTLAAAGLPSVTAREAAVLLGIPQSRAEDLLEFFVDRYLLACADAGHYEFRAFTRAFGRELETHGPAGGPCPPQCMSPVSRAERRGAER